MELATTGDGVVASVVGSAAAADDDVDGTRATPGAGEPTNDAYQKLLA